MSTYKKEISAEFGLFSCTTHNFKLKIIFYLLQLWRGWTIQQWPNCDVRELVSSKASASAETFWSDRTQV